jgi:hypothetical protein
LSRNRAVDPLLPEGEAAGPAAAPLPGTVDETIENILRGR